MRHLFIMDPPGTIEVSKDTSSLLMKEGLERGHEIYVAGLTELLLTPQLLRVRARQVLAVDMEAGKYDLAEVRDELADEFAVIWLRKDPPFDETYLAHLSLFDHLTNDQVLFVNDPGKVRELNEKLTIFNFPEFIADTIVTMSTEAVWEFWNNHGKIVVKPLNGFSGIGIEVIEDWEKDAAKVEGLIGEGQFIMAQEFLENVYEGDKRVYILDGEVLGQMLRVPTGDSFKGNLHAGGRAEATELTERERKIAETVASFLKEAGIVFAGIDLIDGYLTEINVTSPGVLIEANAVSGRDMEKEIWEVVERLT